MFTGIVQEIGIVKNKLQSENSYQLVITAEKSLQDIKIGESIAINGVCLTVVAFTKNTFTADVMPTTLNNTNLQQLKSGSKVNIEQALRFNDFLSGHLVTGHIDGVGNIVQIKKDFNAYIVTISFSAKLAEYMVDKGSVALNGVSLTIVDLTDNTLTVSLIPETWGKTLFQDSSPGDLINIETDIIAKYLSKMLNKKYSIDTKSDISREFLSEKGFL